MSNVSETPVYCSLGHEDCPYCPRPCQLCSRPCFQGRCYDCYPDRVIECGHCGERLWDGICDCDTDEEEPQEDEEDVQSE